jgi:hypothetical protein
MGIIVISQSNTSDPHAFMGEIAVLVLHQKATCEAPTYSLTGIIFIGNNMDLAHGSFFEYGILFDQLALT